MLANRRTMEGEEIGRHALWNSVRFAPLVVLSFLIQLEGLLVPNFDRTNIRVGLLEPDGSIANILACNAASDKWLGHEEVLTIHLLPSLQEVFRV